jgi:hypothetical protein
MTTQFKTAIASVTGAAALTLAVGFGAVGAGPAGGAAAHPTPGVSATQPAPIVQHATLTGCIVGANC